MLHIEYPKVSLSKLAVPVMDVVFPQGLREVGGISPYVMHKHHAICQSSRPTHPAAILSCAESWILVQRWTTPSSGSCWAATGAKGTP